MLVIERDMNSGCHQVALYASVTYSGGLPGVLYAGVSVAGLAPVQCGADWDSVPAIGLRRWRSFFHEAVPLAIRLVLERLLVQLGETLDQLRQLIVAAAMTQGDDEVIHGGFVGGVVLQSRPALFDRPVILLKAHIHARQL